MRTVDVLIVVAFVAYAVTSGIRHRRQASKNLEEYFLAGRTLPGWKAGLSMAATQFAADTPLLVTGIVAVSGVFGLWQLWIFAVTFLLMGFVLAGAWRRAGVLTDAELTEVRYAGTPAAVLRAVKAFYLGTIINCVSLGWVLFAAAKIAEPFLLWNVWLPPGLFDVAVVAVEWVGVPLSLGGLDDPEVWIKTASNAISLGLILTVTLLYSATGGLRSVADTDVVHHHRSGRGRRARGDDRPVAGDVRDRWPRWHHARRNSGLHTRPRQGRHVDHAVAAGRVVAD